MDLEYLIQILTNKINILNNARNQSFSSGDIDSINAIDQQLLETQNTLSQLNILLAAQNAATATNSSTAAVIASGIQASQTQGPSASAIVNGYDISSYATDALYEQKIEGILAVMPSFATAGDIDTYIQGVDPGSPITGEMVLAAATTYNVDIPLLLAIMQNDSQFGTQGIGASTFNPGNVGNTGTATQTYASWEDGVAAVAAWLNNHRVATAAPAPVASATIDSSATDTPAADTSDASNTAPTVTNTVTPPVSTPTVAPTATTSTTTPAVSTADTASSTPATVIGTTASSTPDTSTDATTTPPISIPADTSTASTTSTSTSTSP